MRSSLLFVLEMFSSDPLASPQRRSTPDDASKVSVYHTFDASVKFAKIIKQDKIINFLKNETVVFKIVHQRPQRGHEVGGNILFREYNGFVFANASISGSNSFFQVRIKQDKTSNVQYENEKSPIFRGHEPQVEATIFTQEKIRRGFSLSSWRTISLNTFAFLAVFSSQNTKTI